MIYGFDQNTAEKIVQATGLTLAHPLGRQVPRENSFIGAMVAHHAIILITSTTVTNGFVRCKWATTEILNTGTPAITFEEQAEEGWAYGLNDGGLQDTNYYLAQFRGYKPDDGKAVFVAGAAGNVIAKCTNSTPQNIGGQFLFSGKTQNFRSGNLQFNDAKDCYIRDANNAEFLVLNNRYAGYVGGKWAADGRPIVLIEDFNLSAVDLHTGTTFDRVRLIQFDSTPTAYDNTKGDWIFTWTASTRTLKVRHNGRTATDPTVIGCQSGQQVFANDNFSNGLKKTRT